MRSWRALVNIVWYKIYVELTFLTFVPPAAGAKISRFSFKKYLTLWKNCTHCGHSKYLSNFDDINIFSACCLAVASLKSKEKILLRKSSSRQLSSENSENQWWVNSHRGRLGCLAWTLHTLSMALALVQILGQIFYWLIVQRGYFDDTILIVMGHSVTDSHTNIPFYKDRKNDSLFLKFRKVFVPHIQPSGRGIILVRQHNWNCYRKFMYFSPALRTHSQNTSLFCYNWR